MNELRDKIAREACECYRGVGIWESSTTNEVVKDFWKFIASQILALIKEAGYVKLADNQTTPANNYFSPKNQEVHRRAIDDMIKDGWRKVEIWKSP